MVDPRPGQRLLLLAVGHLVALLVWLVAAVAVAQARVVESFWTIDPHSRFVQVYNNSLSYASFAGAYFHVEILRPVFVLAMICVSLLIVQLGRVGCQSRLALTVLPVLAPVLLVLAAALPVTREDQLTLAKIHEWVSPEELHFRWDSPDLEPCSRLLALDTISSLAPPIIVGVTAVILVPAAVTAWRAGADGSRLGKGWSRAAVLCFLLGAGALASTRAHRADRVQVLAACTHHHDPRNQHWVDPAPADFHGMRVEPCISPPAWADANDRYLESAHELHASGEFAFSGGAARDPHALVRILNFPWHPEAVFPLYAEEHTPMPVLAEILEALRNAKIETVLLLGTSTISGEFATLGPWRQRVHCTLGVLHFNDPERNIDEFESFAELAAAASVDGGLHLQLTP